MDDSSRRKAKAIKSLPFSTLEYLPPRKWRFLSALIVLVIVLSILFGQMIYTNIKFSRMEAEMEKNKSLWESLGISRYYYSISISEILPMTQPNYTLRVLVNEGKSEVDGPNTDSDKYDSYDSIPDLFDIISKAIATKPDGTAELRIKYDQATGYPTYISLGDRDNLLGRVGYFTYTVANFKNLEE